MKKLVLIMIAFAMIITVNGQTQTTDTIATTDSIQFKAFANVQLASKNMLTATGTILENAASFNTMFYIGLEKGKWGIGLTGLSQKSLTGTQTTYNLVDIMGTYKASENLVINTGYELTIFDHTDGDVQIGHNLLAIINWNKNKWSITGIALANIQLSDIYLVISAKYKLTNQVSMSGLFGYCNKIGCYEMLEITYTYQKVDLGVNVFLNTPGIGFTAKCSIF